MPETFLQTKLRIYSDMYLDYMARCHACLMDGNESKAKFWQHHADHVSLECEAISKRLQAAVVESEEEDAIDLAIKRLNQRQLMLF